MRSLARMYACTYIARKDNKNFRKRSYRQLFFCKKERPDQNEMAGTLCMTSVYFTSSCGSCRSGAAGRTDKSDRRSKCQSIRPHRARA